MQYRADIDGLRALAVLPVVFYHAGFSLFSGGFVGVDVFFVISGYLITSLIYPEITSSTFTYHNFYIRRVRRLFPALFTVVIACFIPAYFWLLPQELEDFGESVASLALFSSNILFWSEAGYFATAAEMKPLLHTWSLAIEEQYYLLFPVFLLGVQRLSPQLLVPATAGLFMTSLLLASTTVYTHPEAAFYLLPSRTWELLLGSLLAMLAIQISHRWLCEILALAGIAMIAAAVFLYDASTPFPGIAALLPCLGTAMVILAGSKQPTYTTRLLTLRPLVFIGLISYSLYLWHWPLIAFAKHFYVTPLSSTIVWTLLACAFVVSVLSWRFVEQPFRRRGAKLSSRWLFGTAAGMMVGIIGVGLVLDKNEGLPQRLPENVATILAVANDKPKHRKRCEGQNPADLNLSTLCKIGDPGLEPTILLWGDSHANMLASQLGEVLATTHKAGVYAVANGCVPLLNVERIIRDTDVDCLAFNQSVLDVIAAHPSLDTIVLGARWGLHATGLPIAEHAGPPRFLQTQALSAGDTFENQEIFTSALLGTLNTLSALDRRIIVLGPVPEAAYDVPSAFAKATWRQQDLPLSISLLDFLARQKRFFGVMKALHADTNIEWIGLHAPFCADSACSFVGDDLPLYFDDNHLASAGIKKLAAPLASVSW